MTVHQQIAGEAAPGPYRFSQREFLLLDEHGAFEMLAKAELIDGVIVAVNAQHSRHVRVQTNLLRALADACDAIGGGIGAWVEGSLSIDEWSMPQPDMFVTRDLPDKGPMTLDRMLIVIEVADTTLRFDIGKKARLYALAGIAEYWVADVNALVIHQMWAPAGDTYGERRKVTFGERIEAATVTGLAIETSRLL